MAIQESVKASDKEPTKSNLVDLTAAAQSLKDPWGGMFNRNIVKKAK